MGSTYRELADKATVGWIKQVYEIVAKSSPRNGAFVADAETKPNAHGTDEIKQIKDIMYEAAKAARVADGGNFLSVEEYMGKVRDNFWNPMSGIGSADDPGMFNYAYTPVSMAPHEATAYYSSGGIARVIIDKKSKGVLTNGYTFEGDGWAPGDITRLHDYAELVGFGEAQVSAIRDGLIYGGSVAYPRLKKDNVQSMEFSVDQLIKSGILTQDSIDHFVTTDRWNCVLVPNWNVTARDYISPSHYYIPIGGIKVSTERSAVVRPNMLPYWGMLPQMGWGISDFEGWMPSVLAYMVVVMSIPIMAQQMSLLFHEIPIDGNISMNGAGEDSPTAELLAHNDKVMRSWSIVHPATVNSFGKISAVERSYTGFTELITVMRQDIAARSEIPESVIFHTQPTGFSDNEEDTTLKESAAIQKIGVTVRPQMRPLARMLAISCFGPDYFEGDRAKLLQTIGVSYDSPTVQTPTQKADVGSKFAEMVNKFVSSDMPLDAAIDLSKQFFPGVEIPVSIMDRIRQNPAAVPVNWEVTGGVQAMNAGGLVEKLLGLSLPATVTDGLTDTVDTRNRIDGYRLTAIEEAVRSIANKPEPGPVQVQIEQRPVEKRIHLERDEQGNIKLDSIVVTERVIEEK